MPSTEVPYTGWITNLFSSSIDVYDGEDFVGSATQLSFNSDFTVRVGATNRINVEINNGPLDGVILSTDLTSLTGTYNSQLAHTVGRSTAGDGGGGTFYWHSGSSTTADSGTVFGNTIAGRWKRQFTGAVNVKWFGAKGDGSTNDTDAFDAAIAAVVANGGGEVLVPGGGKYPVNLTITADNILLRGGDCQTSTPTSALIPYDATKPVIQIGDDTADVRNTRIRDLNFFGYNPSAVRGAKALYLYGGAELTDVTNCSITNFGAYGIHLKSGVSYPVQHPRFRDVTIYPTDTAGVYLEYGSQWVSGVVFDACVISATTSRTGRCIINDGVPTVWISNTWIQAFPSKGLQFLKSGSTLPRLTFTNSTVDSDDSNDILVESYTTRNVSPHQALIMGNVTVDGLLQYSDGTTTDLKLKGFSSPDNTTLSYPFIQGSISLGDSANNWAISTSYSVGNEVYANSRIYICTTAGTSAGSGTGPSGTGTGIADGTCVWDYVIGLNDYSNAHRAYASGGQLWLQSSGNIRLTAGAGKRIHANVDTDVTGKLSFNGVTVTVQSGTGSPEGSKAAPIGSLYLRTDGGAGTTFYVKESGTGSTGWVAK